MSSGVMSAIGFLCAPLAFDFVRSLPFVIVEAESGPIGGSGPACGDAPDSDEPAGAPLSGSGSG